LAYSPSFAGFERDAGSALAVAAEAALVTGVLLGSAFWSAPLFGEYGPLVAL